MKEMLSALFTASRFDRDWYGYLTNQASHTMLGLFAVWLACTVSFWISEDLPYRTQLFVGLAAIYATKEVVVDRWQGFDTVEDFTFVIIYGVGGTLSAFKQMNNFSADVVFNMHASLPFMVAFVAHLTLGSVYRWRKARKGNDERAD